MTAAFIALADAVGASLARWRMGQDRKQSRIKQCGRVIGPVESRPSKPAARIDRLSIVRKGSDPSAEMGDWVIDEAE